MTIHTQHNSGSATDSTRSRNLRLRFIWVALSAGLVCAASACGSTPAGSDDDGGQDADTDLNVDPMDADGDRPPDLEDTRTDTPAEDVTVDPQVQDAPPDVEVLPDTDLGDADTNTQEDATDTPDRIACAEETCEAGSEVCVACVLETEGDAEGDRVTYCVPLAESERVLDVSAEAMENGCGYTTLFLGCDGSADCGPGNVCVFSGGEYGSSFCAEAGTYTSGVACRHTTDCSADAPTCGEFDTFGYFTPFSDLLDWLPPTACGGASAEASAFCSRYGSACGYGDGISFYARAGCLSEFDRMAGPQRTCVMAHLELAEETPTLHCAHATGTGPCE